MIIRTILHPTDFSRYSENAWRVACSLARDYGANLLVLHVREVPVAVYGEFGTVPPDTYDAEALRRELATVEPTVSGLSVERRLTEGNPAAEIVRVAKENNCDLIVLGTHGRTGLGRLLMGSVAEQVVRKATCPVLTVKTPIAEKEAVASEVEAEAATAS
jgi:nucleotide-binding universal stress UspA family protein